eukprot:3103361-Prorocentrum_lima.AAC.1
MDDDDTQLGVALSVEAGSIFMSTSTSCALTLTPPIITLTNGNTSHMLLGFFKEGWLILSYHTRLRIASS